MFEDSLVRVVHLPLGLDGASVVIPEAAGAREPPGAGEPGAGPVRPAGGGHGLLVDQLEVKQLVLHQVEEGCLPDESVHQLVRVSELLESPEDSVPDAEDSGVVFIQAVPICSVVHSVKRGCVEDESKWSQVSSEFRVNP